MAIVTVLIGLCSSVGAGPALAQKLGGAFRHGVIGTLPDLSIHETAVRGVTLVAGPMYNNLVLLDTLDQSPTVNTLVAELAEGWEWRNDGKELVFKLRPGVTWHDGKPFTGADVKQTYDMVRGALRGGFKLNPRKLWYFNVREIVTAGDREVTFRLNRPQPSFLTMLASGFSPVYPAHVSPAKLRTAPLGTGPFMLKASLPDQQVVEVRNPNYFRRGRPYLDSVQFIVFKSADSHHAALIAKQIDAAALLATPGPVYERLKAGRHGVEFAERVTNATVNIIFNTKKPPFDDVAMRRIVNLALDRESAIKTVFQSGGVPGTAFVPKPYGAWGATPEQLRALPGMGPSEENKAEARRLLREKGYSDAKPFRFTMTTRNTVTTTGSSNWGVGELKKVGILAEIKLVDTGNWYGIVARRDFLFAFNETAIVIDDPDAGLYENYTCHSQRNYTDYCNPELEKKFDEQSLESDPARRRSLVQEIDFKLQADGARPYITYRKDWYAHYPWVKNYVPQAAIYNNWRMDDLWLDQ